MKTELKENEYQCDNCGEVYEKGRPDTEALAESVEKFGYLADNDVAVICEDCYNKMMGITK